MDGRTEESISCRMGRVNEHSICAMHEGSSVFERSMLSSCKAPLRPYVWLNEHKYGAIHCSCGGNRVPLSRRPAVVVTVAFGHQQMGVDACLALTDPRMYFRANGTYM